MALLAAIALPSHAYAQPAPATARAASAHGTVERIVVHGKFLEGNLEGDSPDREVSIYLPAAYRKTPGKRFPIVYFLHEFRDSDRTLYAEPGSYLNIPTVADAAIADGSTKPVIIVTPDAHTRFGGSNYSSSATTGDWERFIVSELVPYIDAHYRTIARREARGIAGHSMGGYGAIRLAMKYPTTFSSVYALSACCLAPEDNIPKTPEAMAKVEAVRSPADFDTIDIGVASVISAAAAWAPDPDRAPLYFDLPVSGGQIDKGVVARFVANKPIAMADQYITNLRTLSGIGFDVGAQDKHAVAAAAFDRILTSEHVPHLFTIYDPGVRAEHVAERVRTVMLPFFSRLLRSEP